MPSLGGGGAERVIVNLAAGFAVRGFRTDLVLASAEGPYLAKVPPSVRVVDLKASGVLRSVRSLAGYLRRERPVALLAALNHANLVAMAAARVPGARTRIVISIHSTIVREIQDAAGDRTWAIIYWLLKRLHPLADAIVAVSEGVAEDFARFANIARDRINVIPNAVITQALLDAASEAPSHPWFQDRTPVVLGVGRLVPSKNFPALIEAFALVSREHDARLVILGEGPERCALEAKVRQHGLQDSVALPGFLDNPYACMSRARVFALSSDFEGLPTVLIESLAVGTPVIATDCESGPREILRGGALGGLVPVGDVGALARGIALALTAQRVPPPWDALRPFMSEVVLDQYQRILGVHA
jgi:glycosyltransferase involved in cell wall biosynthesis